MMSPIGTKTAPKMLERPSHSASCLQMRTASRRLAQPAARCGSVGVGVADGSARTEGTPPRCTAVL